jgi:IS1 family transposase
VRSYLDSLWFSGWNSSSKHMISHIYYQRTERQFTLWALLWALCFTTVAETSNWRRYVWDSGLSVW